MFFFSSGWNRVCLLLYAIWVLVVLLCAGNKNWVSAFLFFLIIVDCIVARELPVNWSEIICTERWMISGLVLRSHWESQGHRGHYSTSRGAYVLAGNHRQGSGGGGGPVKISVVGGGQRGSKVWRRERIEMTSQEPDLDDVAFLSGKKCNFSLSRIFEKVWKREGRTEVSRKMKTDFE